MLKDLALQHRWSPWAGGWPGECRRKPALGASIAGSGWAFSIPIPGWKWNWGNEYWITPNQNYSLHFLEPGVPGFWPTGIFGFGIGRFSTLAISGLSWWNDGDLRRTFGELFRDATWLSLCRCPISRCMSLSVGLFHSHLRYNLFFGSPSYIGILSLRYQQFFFME